jgi:hypothetical protein
MNVTRAMIAAMITPTATMMTRTWSSDFDHASSAVLSRSHRLGGGRPGSGGAGTPVVTR